MTTRQELEQIALECGATPYVNRHYPDKLTMAFGPDAWEAFCDKLAEPPAQQEHVPIEHCIWARNGNAPCPHTTQKIKQCWKCGDSDPAFTAICQVPACGMRE